MNARTLMAGVLWILAEMTTGCDHAHLEAYPQEEPRPLYAAVHVIRWGATDGSSDSSYKIVVEVVASDKPMNCDPLDTGGSYVLRFKVPHWETGDQNVEASLTSSAPTAARLRWALGDDESGSVVGDVANERHTIDIRLDTAPVAYSESAKFTWPLIRVATLPPVEAGSACERTNGWPQPGDCPLPTRIERLEIGADALLCNDIAPSAIDPYFSTL